MNLPSTAIIIPTRNRTDALKRCLQQFIGYASADRNCRIVVSDDGDASETRGALADEFELVRVIQGPRKGPAANRNWGAANSTGDLLIFLDDDCIPEPDLIAIYREFCRSNPTVDIVEGRISSSGEPSSFADMVPVNETGGYLWSCNFAIRRELFEKVKGFDERFPFAAMEDVDLHLRVRQHSPVVFLRDARVWHAPEKRLGWKIVQHQSLSVLLYLHIHGLKTTNRSVYYFLHFAARLLVFDTIKHLRSGTTKYPKQLWFRAWANVQLAFVVLFWNSRRLLAKKLYPPCCAGCAAIHECLVYGDGIPSNGAG